jgi:hypothetical protein
MKSLALAALVIFSLMALGGQAQTGTITGVVLDPSGAFIPGAAVAATRVATGDVSRAITNESGAYTFSNLPAGTYDVAAGLPGFAISRSGPVVVGPSTSVLQNFALSLQQQQPRIPVPPLSPFSPTPVPDISADSQSTQGAVTSYRGRVRLTNRSHDRQGGRTGLQFADAKCRRPRERFGPVETERRCEGYPAKQLVKLGRVTSSRGWADI